MPKLIVRKSGAPDIILEVTDKVITVGRSKNSIVYIDDPKASRHHCMLFEESGIYYVEDKGSSNGTYLNFRKVYKGAIKAGDAIVIGRHIIFFESIPEDATMIEQFAETETKDRPQFAKIAEMKPSDTGQISSDATSPIYVLDIVEGAEAGKRITLGDTTLTIGRNSQNQLVASDSLASNYHAEIRKEGGIYFIYDLGSTNGTFLNGKKIVKGQLYVDMEIKVASLRMIFKNIGKATENDFQPVGEMTAMLRIEDIKVKKRAISSLWLATAGLALAVLAAGYVLYFQPFKKAGPAKTATLSQKNYLEANPSFEGEVAGDATPEGWKFDVSKAINVYVDRSKNRTGNASLTFQNIGSDGQLSFNAVSIVEPLRVQPNRTFAAKAFVLAENSVGFNGLRVRLFDTERPSMYIDYYTTPVSRTHTSFMESSCKFTVPPWANSLIVSCIAAGERGNVWFDDISITEADAPELPFCELTTITSPNKLFLDRSGNMWVMNKKNDLIAVINGLNVSSDTRGISSSQAMQSTVSTPEFIKQMSKGSVRGFIHNLANDSKLQMSVSTSMSDKTGTIVYSSGAFSDDTQRISLSMTIDASHFDNYLRVASGNSIAQFIPDSGRVEGALELILGRDKNLLAIVLGDQMNLSAVKTDDGCLKVELFPQIKANEKTNQITLMVNTESPAIAARLDNLLKEARAIVKSGDLLQAERIFASVKTEFVGNDNAIREANKGLDEVAKEITKLDANLKEIITLIEAAEQAEKVDEFEVAFEQLRAFISKLEVRAPNSELYDRAVKAAKESESLTGKMEKKILERKASKLLDKAKEAQKSEQFILCRAILEKLLSSYPDTASAKEAEVMIIEARRMVDLVKLAAQEWEEVAKKAETLEKTGKKDAAKEAVRAFSDKYPFFVPAKAYLKILE